MLLPLLCLLLALAMPGCGLPQPKALVDFSQGTLAAERLAGSFVWLGRSERDNRLFRLHLETGELSSRKVSSKVVAFSRTTKDGDFAMLRKSGGPFHRKLIVEVANWNDGHAEPRIIAEVYAPRDGYSAVALSSDGGLVAAAAVDDQPAGNLWVWNSEGEEVLQRELQAPAQLLFDSEVPVLYFSDSVLDVGSVEDPDASPEEPNDSLFRWFGGGLAMVSTSDFRSGSTRALHSTYSFLPRAGGGILAQQEAGWATFHSNGVRLEDFGPLEQDWMSLYGPPLGAVGPDTLLVPTPAPLERRTSRGPSLTLPDHLWELSATNTRTGATTPLMTNVASSSQVVWSPH